MPDRAQVLTGLKDIYDEAYDRWVHRQFVPDKLIDLIRENIPMAFELFLEEKKEGVKPEKSNEWGKMWRCGACKGVVAIQEPYSEDWYISCNYCPHCGTKVKWNE